MLTDERLHRILETLEKNGQVKSKSLAHDLQVSEVTVRNDLSLLEERGLLRRVHGGAVHVETKIFDPTFQEQKAIDKDEKKEIAQKMAALVEKNDVIYVDSGSSTLFFIERLIENPPLNLTVVTSSLYVINEVVQGQNVNLFVIGGEFRKNSFNFIDAGVFPLVEKYSVNKIILGINGLDENGIYASNLLEANVKAELCKMDAQLFVLASSSKLFRKSLRLISTWRGTETIVTSTTALEQEPRLRELQRERKVDIV